MHGALTIRRLRADCHVAGESNTATSIGDRVTRGMRDHLPQALRSVFEPWLDGSDDSIWVVRRLDLVILTSGDTQADDLASAMTRALGRALATALTGDGDGVNAVRFPSRAAYLAQFIADVATGEAWGRWYYEPFGGLRLLTPSAALRTALVQDPEKGWTALQSLDGQRLARVAGSLTSADTDLLVDAFVRHAPDAADRDAVFIAAQNGCGRALHTRLTNGRWLFAMVQADMPPSPQLAWAVRTILDAVDAAMGTGSQEDRPARSERPTAETTALAKVVGELLDHACPGSGADQAGSLDGLVFTRFGGIALLLRDVDALPWGEWTESWPETEDGRAADLLKWLCLGLCSGRTNLEEFAADGVWKWLLCVSNETSLERTSVWLRQVGARRCAALASVAAPSNPTAADRRWLTCARRGAISPRWNAALAEAAGLVLRGFAKRLPGFADATFEYLWRNFLDMDATITVDADRVVVECGRPPLHLLLTMTGMTRGLLTGHAARGLPIVVFSRG